MGTFKHCTGYYRRVPLYYRFHSNPAGVKTDIVFEWAKKFVSENTHLRQNFPKFLFLARWIWFADSIKHTQTFKKKALWWRLGSYQTLCMWHSLWILDYFHFTRHIYKINGTRQLEKRFCWTLSMWHNVAQFASHIYGSRPSSCSGTFPTCLWCESASPNRIGLC